jgi:hypothetical protein
VSFFYIYLTISKQNYVTNQRLADAIVSLRPNKDKTMSTYRSSPPATFPALSRILNPLALPKEIHHLPSSSLRSQHIEHQIFYDNNKFTLDHSINANNDITSNTIISTQYRTVLKTNFSIDTGVTFRYSCKQMRASHLTKTVS